MQAIRGVSFTLGENRLHPCEADSRDDSRQVKGPMIKLVYCITKKASITDQEFFRYWKDVHGAIGARIPRLRKLVQSHRYDIPGDPHRPDYDGIAELWFDDAEDLLAARQTPEWTASTEDEANFIDHGKVAYFVSEEHIVLDSLGQER